MKVNKRWTIGSSNSGSCKVRALEVLGFLEKRDCGIYKSHLADDVFKYLFERNLITVENRAYTRRCTKDIVHVVPKEKIEERKLEPYKKRKQRIKDDAAYQKRKNNASLTPIGLGTGVTYQRGRFDSYTKYQIHKVGKYNE